jgi:bacteriocin-like protein
MSVNEIRELTNAELNEVTGGLVVELVVLGAAAVFGFGMALPGTDFIEEGKKYLQGKGGQL